MKSTFKVLFMSRGSVKENGEVMIMARITIDGLCQFMRAGQLCGQPSRDAGRIPGHTFFTPFTQMQRVTTVK